MINERLDELEVPKFFRFGMRQCLDGGLVLVMIDRPTATGRERLIGSFTNETPFSEALDRLGIRF